MFRLFRRREPTNQDCIAALRQQLKGAQYALIEAQQAGDEEHAENLIAHIKDLGRRIHYFEEQEDHEAKMARWEALERKHGYDRRA